MLSWLSVEARDGTYLGLTFDQYHPPRNCASANFILRRVKLCPQVLTVSILGYFYLCLHPRAVVVGVWGKYAVGCCWLAKHSNACAVLVLLVLYHASQEFPSLFRAMHGGGMRMEGQGSSKGEREQLTQTTLIRTAAKKKLAKSLRASPCRWDTYTSLSSLKGFNTNSHDR